MPDESKILTRAADRAHRFLTRILSKIRPAASITLSPFLFLCVYLDKAQLRDNLSECWIDLPREAARTFLDLARLASSSGQIRAINLAGLAIEIDGQPRDRALMFDYNPISWIWNPSLVTLKPTTDYIHVDIKCGSDRIRGFIENARVDLACAELAKLDAISSSGDNS
jgi:hypothetical protein